MLSFHSLFIQSRWLRRCCCISLLMPALQLLGQSKQPMLIDTHNDVLSNSTMKGIDIGTNLRGKSHSDLARFREGGVSLQFFSVFCDERYGTGTAFAYANQMIDSLERIAKKYPQSLRLIPNTSSLDACRKQGVLAGMIGVEGGHMIEDRLDYLDSLYRRGTRYMTLTWNNSTSWASSAKDETSRRDSLAVIGLSDHGRKIVARMNQLGMMVDLSHVGEATFKDVMAVVQKPVLVSHSSCHALCPVPRNLKDEQIKAVAKNNGVICVNFYAGFLDSNYKRNMDLFVAAHAEEVAAWKKQGLPYYTINEMLSEKYKDEANALRPPLSLLIDHIDHLVRVGGINHVGLGSDFDGIESPPKDLDGVEHYPRIAQALKQRGYSKKEIAKIFGGNVLRVMKANGI
jgi:membrane dipeptidase